MAPGLVVGLVVALFCSGRWFVGLFVRVGFRWAFLSTSGVAWGPGVDPLGFLSACYCAASAGVQQKLFFLGHLYVDCRLIGFPVGNTVRFLSFEFWFLNKKTLVPYLFQQVPL